MEIRPDAVRIVANFAEAIAEWIEATPEIHSVIAEYFYDLQHGTGTFAQTSMFDRISMVENQLAGIKHTRKLAEALILLVDAPTVPVPMQFNPYAGAPDAET